MNLNICFDIPSKYIENFCVIVSVPVGTFSERLTDTSCQDFSFWFFCGISLAMVKTDVKNQGIIQAKMEADIRFWAPNLGLS